MPGSVMSVFSEPDDFEAALGEEGCLGLLITGRGLFQARLTQIALHPVRRPPSRSASCCGIGLRSTGLADMVRVADRRRILAGLGRGRDARG